MRPKTKDFIDDILLVCKRHNMSISHEDSHGSFIINKYNNYDSNWLKEAEDYTKEENLD